MTRTKSSVPRHISSNLKDLQRRTLSQFPWALSLCSTSTHHPPIKHTQMIHRTTNLSWFAQDCPSLKLKVLCLGDLSLLGKLIWEITLLQIQSRDLDYCSFQGILLT